MGRGAAVVKQARCPAFLSRVSRGSDETGRRGKAEERERYGIRRSSFGAATLFRETEKRRTPSRRAVAIRGKCQPMNTLPIRIIQRSSYFSDLNSSGLSRRTVISSGITVRFSGKVLQRRHPRASL